MKIYWRSKLRGAYGTPRVFGVCVAVVVATWRPRYRLINSLLAWWWSPAEVAVYDRDFFERHRIQELYQ